MLRAVSRRLSLAALLLVACGGSGTGAELLGDAEALPAVERDALRAIFERASVDPKGVRVVFGTRDPLRTEGVGVRVDDGHVIALIITNRAFDAPGAIEKLTSLRELELAYNQLSSFRTPNPCALETVKLTGNRLAAVEGLGRCPNLTKLGLRRNAIETVAWLGDLPKLESLDLAHNPLTTIEPLGAMPELTSIDLAGTKITEAKALARFKNLKFAGLDKVNLQSKEGLDHIKRVVTDETEAFRKSE